MSIHTIFPDIPMNESEQEEILQTFSKDVTKKYLRLVAQEAAKELLDLPALSNATNISTAHALVQGKLQVINTLLSIQANSN